MKDELKIENSNVAALKANLEEERQNKYIVSVQLVLFFTFGVELEEKLTNANIQINECKHQNEKLKQEAIQREQDHEFCLKQKEQEFRVYQAERMDAEERMKRLMTNRFVHVQDKAFESFEKHVDKVISSYNSRVDAVMVKNQTLEEKVKISIDFETS